MFGGRKWVCTSNRPGSPSPSQKARTGSTSSERSGGRSPSVIHPLQPPANSLLDLPVGLPLGERGPLVPRLLALGQRDLDLGAAVEEVEGQRDDGEAALVDPALDLVD